MPRRRRGLENRHRARLSGEGGCRLLCAGEEEERKQGARDFSGSAALWFDVPGSSWDPPDRWRLSSCFTFPVALNQELTCHFMPTFRGEQGRREICFCVLSCLVPKVASCPFHLSQTFLEWPLMLHNHSSVFVPDREEMILIGGGGNCFSFGTHLNWSPVRLDLSSILTAGP